MIFTTYTFLVFFLALLLVYALTPRPLRKYVMIVGGFVFYAYDSIGHFFFLLALTCVVYVISLSEKRPILLYGICVPVGFLLYYKYWKMAVSTWNSVFAGWFSATLPAVHIAVPLAISFFVFEFVHYLADVYKGKTERVSFSEFFLFIFFFPSLVAGPIKRIQSFSKEKFLFSFEHVQKGMIRMGIGLFKKIVLADSLNPLFMPVFDDPHKYPPDALWVAMYAYAFKIYFDFSAYSDIAIGAAQCFGFHLPENFNWPYISRNLVEFWRRWHISLSTWIRDYLYIPMGGNRKGYLNMLLFIFLAMTISGLWHGANWTFVIWGMWHGIGQVINKIWNKWRQERTFVPKPLYEFLSWGLTFQFVCFGWIFFASPTIHNSIVFFVRMWGIHA
ncbi:hypothetical protein LSG31_21870 [Fodinisporobacter ferrooxydans]|uniref:MBOAT family protein n=1 Tax=Fodinisporobacter ferrooxydans TaxID=2901836 RepID=A0ABY4CJ48_9BACL|nr:hypothetical protein LSG31_21870 [Alicyclobacillaceae bacterium MYW30-H2]